MATDRSPITVLLVEDDEDDYILTRGLFDRMRSGPYRLDWTSDPEAGLADMCAGGHDIYLLDYRLGARTGVELLRSAIAAGASVLAIVLTGMDAAEADREALEAGAADYLEKSRLDATLLERSIRYGLGQRRHEEALRKSHEELERRVADRTAELATANRSLQEADRRKNEFLAVLAHELRNPLAPLRAAAELMRRAGADPEGRSLQQLISRQVGHMARLVDDLLEVSRIATGKLNLQREVVTIGEAVSSAVETARPLVDARGHTLEVEVPDAPILLFADRVRLAQVIANLLLNAAKYTDPGGRVRLAVTRSDDTLQLEVVDDGVGIRAEQLERVFDLFVQIDGPLDRAQGGLGVGLALVKTLTELHGGTVEARSAGPGQGSTFTLRLPVLTDAPALTVVAPTSQQIRGLRILVADDNVDASDSMKLLLEMSGHEVRTVTNGADAVALVASFRPEVALLDIGMPVLNGYEACRQIRAGTSGPRPILVAVTGWGTDDDRLRAIDAGFDRHLVKPVDFDAIEALLVEAARA